MRGGLAGELVFVLATCFRFVVVGAIFDLLLPLGIPASGFEKEVTILDLCVLKHVQIFLGLRD